MTKPDNSVASPEVLTQGAGGHWRFPTLFGVQTIGAIVLFWNAVPLYYQILADPAAHEARPENLVWAVSSIALMQLGYWTSDRVRPSPPQFTNALLGHITLFVARMSFVFATSIFGFLFIVQKPGFHIPIFRYVVTIVGVFSLYCYTRELERLGGALLRPDGKRAKTNQTNQNNIATPMCWGEFLAFVVRDLPALASKHQAVSGAKTRMKSE